jgi:ABC-type phosphate/phosphonate transport system substrate-binding protein
MPEKGWFRRHSRVTTPESQSGYAAPLHALMAHGGARPLYREVGAPAVTPMGALRAVIERRADVAPLDSYALALMRRHAPELAAQVRVVGTTEPTAIPPLVASHPVPAITAAFLAEGSDAGAGGLMEALLLERFVRPEPEGYDALRQRFETVRAFRRSHRLAETVDPSFAL